MTEIARGEIHVSLNEREALDGMRRIERDFERTMHQIEREKATAEIDANLRPLDRKLKQARRKVRELEGLAIELEIDADDEEFHAQLAAARAEVKKLDGQKATVEIEVEGEQEAIAARQRIADLEAKQAKLAERYHAQRMREIERQSRVTSALNRQREREEAAAHSEAVALDRARTREMEANEKARMAAIQQRARVVSSLNRQREREEAAAHSEALRMNREVEAGLEAERRRPLEVAKLQRAYAAAYTEADRLNREIARPRNVVAGPAVRQRLELNREQAIQQMMRLRAELEAIGSDPIDVHVDVDRSQTALSRWLRTLSEATVRIGPFTTSIRTAGIALVTLGPIITGLLGSLTSLAAVLTAGIAGGLGIATAGALGFIGAAGGIFAIVKPLTTEFSNAQKAIKAYDDAVRKYGEGSDQAVEKGKQMRRVLRGVPEDVRDQIRALDGVSDRWARLTRSARPEFFRFMGEGIESINAMMPMFARRSVQAFKAVSQGAREWMRGLRSREGQGVIDGILGNFNRSLPAFMRGLGNLGEAIGRWAQSFSRHLTPLGQAFERWGEGLAVATRDTERLDSGTNKLVGAFRATIQWVGAASRVIFQLVRGALGPSVGFTNDMTDGMNNLADSMSTVSGQRGIADFFQRAAETTGLLFRALQPVLELFVEFTTIMRPFTNILLTVAAALGDITAALADFGPIRGVLQAAFAIFLTRTLVGGIRSTATALGGVLTLLRGISGMSVGAGILSLLGLGGARGKGGFGPKGPQSPIVAPVPTGGFVNSLKSMGAAALKWAKPIGLVGVAITGVDLAARAFGSSEGAVMPALNTMGRGFTIMGQSLGILDSEAEKARKRLDELRDSAAQMRGFSIQANIAVGDTGLQFQQALGQERAARAELTRLRRSGTASAEELRAAELNVNLAVRERQRAYGYVVVAQREALRAAREENRLAVARRNQTDEGTAAYERFTRAIERSSARSQAASVNVERAQRGLLPVLDENALAVGRFARKFQSIPAARKLLFTTNDQEILGKIATISNRLAGVGRKDVVAKILADSSSAEEALDRLRDEFRDYRNENPSTKVLTNASDALNDVNNLMERVFPGYEGTNPITNVGVRDQAKSKMQSIMSQLHRLAARPIDVDINLKLGGALAGAGTRDRSSGAPDIIGAVSEGARKQFMSGGLGAAIGAGAGGGRVDRFNPIAAQFGLGVTSGYRPGDPGWHGRNRARDYAGPGGARGMFRFARFMLAAFGRSLKELIYTPLGVGIKNGQAVPMSFFGRKVMADHHDHVHVAYQHGGVFDRSRIIKRPIISAGEEAPRHPEFFISTNPRDSKRSRRLWLAAGAQLGIVEQHARGGARGISGLDKEQQRVAAIIVRVGRAQGATWKQIVAAIATGLVEAQLRNVKHGDRDSLGVFQQRASWGSRRSRLNVHQSARRFFERAKKADKRGMSMGELAQAVQRSAHPERYGQQRGRAIQIARALTGGRTEDRADKQKETEAPDFDPISILERRIAEARAAGRYRDTYRPVPAQPDPVGQPGDRIGGPKGRGGPGPQPVRLAEEGALTLERKLHAERIKQQRKLKEQIAELDRKIRSEDDRKKRRELRQQRGTLTGELAELGTAIREGNQRRVEMTVDMPLAERAALADLTPALADNIAVTRDQIRVWEQRMADAQRRGDMPKVTEAATNLKQFNDQLLQLQQAERLGPIQAMQAMAEITPSLADDVLVTAALHSEWLGILGEAQKSGDPARIQEAASNVAQLGRQLQQLHDQHRTMGPQSALAVAGLTTTLTDDVTALTDLAAIQATIFNEAWASGDVARITDAATALAATRQQLRQVQDQAALLPLNSALAVAELSEGTEDDAAALQQLEAHWVQMLQRAQAEGDHQGIIDAAGQLRSVRDRLGQVQTQAAQQHFVLSEARANLYRQFGSNMAPILSDLPRAGTAIQQTTSGVTAMLRDLSQAKIAARLAGDGGATSVVKNINVTNNFPTPPPDPHTWSQGIGFELQTAV